MLLRNQAERLTTQLLQMQDQGDDDEGELAFGAGVESGEQQVQYLLHASALVLLCITV